MLGGEIGDLAQQLEPTVRERLRSRGMAADWMRVEVVRDADDVTGATGRALLPLSEVVSRPAEYLTA